MDFKEDDCSFAQAKFTAAFYPKFENDKSDSKTRARMIELVSQGLATLEKIKALLEGSICSNDSDWFLERESTSQSDLILTRFLNAHPVDYSTMKLQEMIRLMREQKFMANSNCCIYFHKINASKNGNFNYKMVVHVRKEIVFGSYQKLIRENQGLWPLYRGFFVDVNLFKAEKDYADSFMKYTNSASESNIIDELSNEDANLMLKLKFLPYKIRTFLVRQGMSKIFKDGLSDYKEYYNKQMNRWGTSQKKQEDIGKMLDEWALYITAKYETMPNESAYLTEAEPFLQNYANGIRQNQSNKSPDSVMKKDKGFLVFFPGLPGCGKSALCTKIMENPDGFGDGCSFNRIEGDDVKEKKKYWTMVSDQLKPNTIIFADKNAPNRSVWEKIEKMRITAVPVVPDSEGTENNPFSLDALAVFISRVLQRKNHPGNLDESSETVGFVLLKFYSFYNRKSRRDFESEMYERFGSLVKMPLLKPQRAPLPDSIKTILEDGINLYQREKSRDPSKGIYSNEWAQWETKLRNILTENSDYINSIQVPFDSAVTSVTEQLKQIMKRDHKTLEQKEKTFDVNFVSINLPAGDIANLLDQLCRTDSRIKIFFKDKKILQKAHITLAHIKSHGLAAIESYKIHLKRNVSVRLSALLFSDDSAAFEATVGEDELELRF